MLFDFEPKPIGETFSKSFYLNSSNQHNFLNSFYLMQNANPHIFLTEILHRLTWLLPPGNRNKKTTWKCPTLISLNPRLPHLTHLPQHAESLKLSNPNWIVSLKVSNPNWKSKRNPRLPRRLEKVEPISSRTQPDEHATPGQGFSFEVIFFPFLHLLTIIKRKF